MYIYNIYIYILFCGTLSHIKISIHVHKSLYIPIPAAVQPPTVVQLSNCSNFRATAYVGAPLEHAARELRRVIKRTIFANLCPFHSSDMMQNCLSLLLILTKRLPVYVGSRIVSRGIIIILFRSTTAHEAVASEST